MQLLRDDDTLLLVPPSETKTSIDLARLGNRALEPDDAESERYQVAVMGPGGVGKSALTIRFCQNDFVEDYDPTIEDAYRHHFMVDSAPVTLDIMDTAGQAEYEALRQTWMKENQAFVLVFDITDPSTLKELRTDFYQKIYQMHEVDAPLIVVVGNKLDLDGKRKVSSKEAALIASQMNAPYIEASALSGTGVKFAFSTIVKQIRKRREVRPTSLISQKYNCQPRKIGSLFSLCALV
mmetsp:Transcript_13503/g.16120  ORF Transcript_13503/g.16120 Transcript_13503/m.16120 type:complete len:237 (+) Transcript_13503:349-1059(+)